MPYEPGARYPFGRPHPDAPAELAQFAFMVGANDCVEERLDNTSGDWERSRRSWDAHDYLNGFAIRDSARSGGSSNGNIRVFDTSSGQWRVTWFSMPSYGSGVWSGGMEDGRMVLRRPQKAAGTELDGFSRLTFSNISAAGFDWTGAWVSADGTIEFPFWRISCQKVT